MSLRGNRQKKTAKFSEQNYLFIPLLFSHTLFIPSPFLDLLNSGLYFASLPHPPHLLLLSYFLFPSLRFLHTCYPPLPPSPSYEVKSSQRWEAVHPESRWWPVRTQTHTHAHTYTQTCMHAHTHTQQSHWRIKWKRQYKMSLQLFETQREYYYQTACRLWPLNCILSFFILLFLLLFFFPLSTFNSSHPHFSPAAHPFPLFRLKVLSSELTLSCCVEI